jgi:DNA-binding CsgD family transcriptional regulator
VPANPDVLSLIPLIYDAAEDPALWPDALNQIGRRLGAVGKVVAIDDLRDRSNNMAVAVDIDPAYQRSYHEYYQSINIHMQRARPLLTPGRVLATHQFCSDKETLSSEYYQDFLRPQKDWFHIVGGCVAEDRSILSVVSFIRGRRAGPFTDREIGLLESLMPHLRRAARLHQVFAGRHSAEACLDVLPIAALFVTGRGRVEYSNRAAQEILLANDGIGVDRLGYLRSTDGRLRGMIAEACRAAEGRGAAAGGPVLIVRSSGKRPYAVSVSPIRSPYLFPGGQCAGAVLLIANPDTRREPIAESLGRIYGLTPTEARLASILAEGKDLTEACGEMGIRRTTATTHLRRVGQKVGAKRQAEIVSVILRTVGMMV